MMAAYEQLLNLGNSEVEETTGEEQSNHTRIQGDAATYLTVAWVEEDLFQVAQITEVESVGEALVRDFDDGELRFRWPKSRMVRR